MRGLRLGLSLTGSAPAPAPELVSNGTFDTDATGWTGNNATLSVVAGRLRVTNSSTSAGYAYQAITVETGATYRIKASLFNGTAPNSRFRVGTAQGGSQYLLETASPVDDTFVATGTTVYVSCPVNSTTSGVYAEFDDISLKKV